MADIVVDGSGVSSPEATISNQKRIPRPARSRRTILLTLADAVDHVLRIEEVNPGETRAVERARLAVRSALSTFVSYCTQGFKYYNARHPIEISASIPLSEITVLSNTVTASGWSDFPDWMDVAHLRVDGQSYEVTSYGESTFTVDGTLADGTYKSCFIERLFYDMPQNFRYRGSLSDNKNYYPLIDVSAGVLQSWQDYYDWARSVANPRVFAAVSSDERFQGNMMLAIWPPYTEDVRLNLYYERYPERCDIHRYGTGTISTTGKTVTATSGIFKQDHVGSVIVVGVSSSGEITKSLSSIDLVYEQRVITQFNSSTEVLVDAALTDDVSGRSFYITDPVDVQKGPQQEAFLRLCEYEFARQSRSKSASERYQQFIDSMNIAMADDNRYREAIDDVDAIGDGMYMLGDVSGRPDLL